ncbi:MAG: hypothetical protein M9907_16725 [Burkholderiaceae bacterium]|nr:hypothetical protein [Burkholderiaceae bacterium]
MIESLNRDCLCISLDEQALARALESEFGSPGLFALVRERCPYLFSAQPVFVSRAHLDRMARTIAAIESVVALPAWRDTVLARAPSIARHDGGARGVFLGYDFHLDRDGLGLIEINTNAGGAMLNAALARAQRSCCEAMEQLVPRFQHVIAFEREIFAMFEAEWRRAGRTRPLRRIAIVDASPQQQYLYPEFVLFRGLFERRGVPAIIVDPSSLELHDGELRHDGLPLDLVYNRLTDFYFEEPASAALRDAWLSDAAVVTPHPRAHALYADKRNLVLLSDDASLAGLGVDAGTREVLLAGVPKTELVEAASADRLWAARRGLFFKPVAGYGGRAAYRGDKLTRRAWEDIAGGGYVAQRYAAPGERAIDVEDPARMLKFDLRNYVYDGAVQWVAARLYQGQTTNFRTPGGGFAPVYSTP